MAATKTKPTTADEKTYPGRIIVFDEKHARRHFAAFTDAQLHAAALTILKERIDPNYGYIQDPGKFDPSEEFTLSDQEIAALPSALRQEAFRKRERYERDKREWQNDRDVWLRAKKAVQDKDGKEAFLILQSRIRYEYEGYEIEHLENLETRRR